MATAAQLHEYAQLFAAVGRYQAGDPEAAVYVLERFAEFLEGFVLLLRGQKVKRLTYSHKLFIANFMRGTAAARVFSSEAPLAFAFVAAESAMVSITTALGPIAEDDLRQETVAEFLAVLQRYRSRAGGNFLVRYILRAFPYALARRVRTLIRDPLVNLASDKLVPIESPHVDGRCYINVDGDDYRRFTPIKPAQLAATSVSFEQSLARVNDDELGSSWLRGENCADPLDVLTYSERKLLKWAYYEDYTDTQIARCLGISHNTAIRRRHRIEAKLRGELVGPVCHWCQHALGTPALGRQPRQCPSCRIARRAQAQRDRRAAA